MPRRPPRGSPPGGGGAGGHPWQSGPSTRSHGPGSSADGEAPRPERGEKQLNTAHEDRGRTWPGRLDRALFRFVASRDWPGAEKTLPRLSRVADKGQLWAGAAAGIAASGTPGSGRAAVRGVASLAVASAAVNTLVKRSVRRPRPLTAAVPVIRQLKRQPVTTSFPSGHAASAAAFATGVALESPLWGALVAPVAASVAFSRVYTGVHYPSDVVAGALLGAGAALAVRGLVPTRAQLPSPARPLADAPALPQGEGLIMVANATSGSRTDTGRRTEQEPAPLALARELLPKARFVVCDPGSDTLGEEIDRAAAQAARDGGALGICGGDGSINTAAAAAVREGVPLAVLPGGTHNHFAADLGIEAAGDTCRALEAGHAVGVDLGRFTPQPEDGSDGDAGEAGEADDAGETGGAGCFLNTFSLGAYPDLVRVRERWAHRIGPWPAGILATLHVLRTSGPVEAGMGAGSRPLWMLFAGNCTYRVGLAPVRRLDLADGQLDVRVVKAGRWARARLVVAAFTSAVDRSPLHSSKRVKRLMITDIPPGTHLAFDGEVAEAPRQLLLDKEHEALTVYRPLPS